MERKHYFITLKQHLAMPRRIIVCCMMLATLGSLQAKEVALTQAGTLSQFITGDELTTLTELTLSGPLNGSDILTIRQMAANLQVLNLREANIVSDNRTVSYYGADNYTQNDVIGDFMFYAMTALTKVVMPKAVWSIGSWNTDEPWYNGHTKISGEPKAYYAYDDDANYQGSAAFAYCVNLQEITFSDSLVYIGTKAFNNCVRLASVAIPEGIEAMGAYTFKSCVSLTTVSIPASLGTKNKMEWYVLNENEFNNNDGTYNSHNGFAAYNFYRCENLANVTLAAGIRRLTPYMFSYCAGLTSITLPNSLIRLNSAFEYCSGLAELNVPNSVTQVGSIRGCSSLTSYTVPSGETSIASNAFRGCSSLTKVTLHNGITSLSEWAFGDCTSLSEVNIPANITAIPNYCFYNSGIRNLVLPQNIVTIGEQAFLGCDSLESINIPPLVMEIKPSTFAYCGKLGSITVSNALMKIGNSAFYASGLRNIDLSGTRITELPGECFFSCDKLETVKLPNTLTSMGEQVFYNSGLREIDLSMTKLTTIPSQTFYYCDNLRTALLPATLTNLSSHVFYDSGLREIDLSSTGLTVIPSQTFYSCDSLRTVLLPNALTSLGDHAFNESGLREIDLSQTKLTTILTGTFSSCDSLRIVSFPNALMSIGDQAFYSCDSLRTVLLPGTLKSLGNLAFQHTGLREIDLSATQIESMGDQAFNGCENLRMVRFPATLKKLGNIPFGGAYLRELDLSATQITEIPSSICNCDSLKVLKLPEGLTTIGNNAFQNLKLDSLVIPSKVTSIGNWCFYNGRYKYVSIPSSVTSIGEYAFYDTVIENTLDITPNAALELKRESFNSYGYDYDEDGYATKNWYLTNVYWNSTAEFPKKFFTRIENLYLPEGGKTSTMNDIARVFYNGITNAINVEYSNYWVNNSYSYSSYSVSQPLKAKALTYSRGFSHRSGYQEAAGWETIVLPFDVQEITYNAITKLAPFGSEALNTPGTIPFWLYELGSDGNYQIATAIQANHAYLICMPNNEVYPDGNNIQGTVLFSATDNANGVTLYPTAPIRSIGTKFDLMPVYNSVLPHDTVYVLNKNQSFIGATKTYPPGSVFVKNYTEGSGSEPAVFPFEAYLVSKEESATTRAPLMYSIGGDDGITTHLPGIPLTPDKASRAYSRDGVLYIDSNAPRTIRIYTPSGQVVRIVELREGINEVVGLESGIYLLEGQKVVIGRQ